MRCSCELTLEDGSCDTEVSARTEDVLDGEELDELDELELELDFDLVAAGTSIPSIQLSYANRNSCPFTESSQKRAQ